MGTKVVIRNARCSFPTVWTPEQYQGEGPYNYSSVFLVEPDSKAYKDIEAAIALEAKNKWGAKAEAKLRLFRPNNQKCCFIDGDIKPDLAGYPGMFALTAKRKQEDGRPIVVDRSRSPIVASDGLIYGGCYVNGTVEIWAQEGKNEGIRATLINLQFDHHGESFGGAAPASLEGLDDLSFEDEEGADDLV